MARQKLTDEEREQRRETRPSDSAAVLGRLARAPVFSDLMGQECAG